MCSSRRAWLSSRFHPKDELKIWTNLDPLEQGVQEFPPSLEDSELQDRVVTWIRVQASAAVRTKILWLGINTVPIKQRAQITNEVLHRRHWRARSSCLALAQTGGAEVGASRR